MPLPMNWCAYGWFVLATHRFETVIVFALVIRLLVGAPKCNPLLSEKLVKIKLPRFQFFFLSYPTNIIQINPCFCEDSFTSVTSYPGQVISYICKCILWALQDPGSESTYLLLPSKMSREKHISMVGSESFCPLRLELHKITSLICSNMKENTTAC